MYTFIIKTIFNNLLILKSVFEYRNLHYYHSYNKKKKNIIKNTK